MDDTPRDPAVWKRQQREQWSNVAQGWQRRWVAIGVDIVFPTACI
ncbi:MAG TPA: hypothetical protein VIZ18_14105 [Ktedonobacteraceae bacterium]